MSCEIVIQCEKQIKIIFRIKPIAVAIKNSLPKKFQFYVLFNNTSKKRYFVDHKSRILFWEIYNLHNVSCNMPFQVLLLHLSILFKKVQSSVKKSILFGIKNACIRYYKHDLVARFLSILFRQFVMFRVVIRVVL